MVMQLTFCLDHSFSSVYSVQFAAKRSSSCSPLELLTCLKENDRGQESQCLAYNCLIYFKVQRGSHNLSCSN